MDARVVAVAVAVDADVAVVRVDVLYSAPTEQEYRDLWLLRFTPTVGSPTSRSGPTGLVSRTRRPRACRSSSARSAPGA